MKAGCTEQKRRISIPTREPEQFPAARKQMFTNCTNHASLNFTFFCHQKQIVAILR